MMPLIKLAYNTVTFGILSEKTNGFSCPNKKERFTCKPGKQKVIRPSQECKLAMS